MGSALPTAVAAEKPQPRAASFRILSADNEPLLTDADIDSYFWPTHTIVLKPGVMDRLTAKLKGDLVGGIPFKVEANGTVCYEGVLTIGLSSFSHSCVVVEVPDLWTRPKRGATDLTIAWDTHRGGSSRARIRGGTIAFARR